MTFFDSVFAPQDRDRRERSVNGISVAKVIGRMPDGTYSLQFLSMGADTPSAPARMMMPSAGSKRGMYWMPEVGDEVVVAFEGGDSNMPIVLGALYNSESPTPDQAQPSDENNIRTFVSRSGHEITFDDSPLTGKVTVKTNGGRVITLDDTPPGKLSLSTPSGASIEIDDATGTLSLTAPLSIELNAANITLTGASVSINAAAAVDVQGAVAITLTSAGTIVVTTPPASITWTPAPPLGTVTVAGTFTP
jgi:phage baseplate assembly protein gpV